MNNENIKTLEQLFPFLSPKQTEQYSMLPSLYKEWNEKINVISRKDIDNLFSHHILHSLSIGKISSFDEDTKILDIGTGGGFPGIPLAILFPQCSFHLIDRTAKKIKVVQSVANELGLQNIIAEQIDCMDIKDKYDFIVSRAVTNMQDFLKLAKGKIKKTSFNKLQNGILYLKGSDAYEEMANYTGYYEIFDLKNMFPKEEYFNTKCLVYIRAK
ncbi:MAG: 16S rRNA (guanine(527)-N(7))-methyltransferase RsmG [Bacteroidota bacterium]|nr:16S rRNA (guanine(527)-N(7))-methyltransferase RsmG [Bacteroidota bacterium]